MINSYPSIYNLGHKAVATLLHGDVLIEEKIDGSQISFQIVTDKMGVGEPFLEVRSKGAMINTVAPEGMFKKAVEILTALDNEGKIPPGYIFRGEYLAKPKHNVLAYDHVPPNHIIIFDIEKGEQGFLDPTEKAKLAASLGMTTVPEIARWLRPTDGSPLVMDADTIRGYLQQDSILGGQKIEGVVIKPLRYDLYGRDKKVLMGKFVSEAFKEVHAAEWKTLHGPKSPNDIIREIIVTYASPARWQKALQHLREAGKIENSPKDIDIEKEAREEIMEALWKWAWPNIRRGVARGLPAWYKDELLKAQFEPIAESIQGAMAEARATPEYAEEKASEQTTGGEPGPDHTSESGS